MAVEQLASLRGFDRGPWDELAADNVFASYGWLRTVEETRTAPGESCYFLIRRANGLDAAAACYFEAPGSAVVDLTMFGRFSTLAAALRLNVGPALVCAPRTGLGDHILTRPGASRPERDRWIAELLDALEAYAERRDVVLCFRNVRPDGDSTLRDALSARGYLRGGELPYTYMDLPASFPDYVRDLKRRHPRTAKNIRREIKRGYLARLVYEQLGDPRPDEDALHRLMDSHQRRLNGTVFPYGPRFLTVLREQLGERLTIYVARKDGSPISVVVGFRAGDSMYIPIVGMDAEQKRETAVYFNNSYNVPIDDGIRRGLKRFYCGKLLYEFKARRGFRLLPLSMYLKIPGRIHRAALRPLIAAQLMRMRAMLAPAVAAASQTRAS